MYNEDLDDLIYIIKVFDYFIKLIENNYLEIFDEKMLFGELRFMFFIFVRGKMKWIVIGEIKNKRGWVSILNYKVFNLLINKYLIERIWCILRNGGLVGWNVSEIMNYS